MFTLGGLTLPDTTTGREDYSYEQRLSVALLYLVSQFARRLMNTVDRTAPKAIFLDEAWAITSTPEGAKLVPEVSRMGRSRNTALVLISQNAGDLLQRTGDQLHFQCFRVPLVGTFRGDERACRSSGSSRPRSTRPSFVPSATVNVFSVTSTTARAASASISYPKNYGTGSTQTRHEPVGNHSRRQPPSKHRRIQEPPEMAAPHPTSRPAKDRATACPCPAAAAVRFSRSCSAGSSSPASATARRPRTGRAGQAAAPAAAASTAPAQSPATAAKAEVRARPRLPARRARRPRPRTRSCCRERGPRSRRRRLQRARARRHRRPGRTCARRVLRPGRRR